MSAYTQRLTLDDHSLILEDSRAARERRHRKVVNPPSQRRLYQRFDGAAAAELADPALFKTLHRWESIGEAGIAASSR